MKILIQRIFAYRLKKKKKRQDLALEYNITNKNDIKDTGKRGYSLFTKRPSVRSFP